MHARQATSITLSGVPRTATAIVATLRHDLGLVLLCLRHRQPADRAIPNATIQGQCPLELVPTTGTGLNLGSAQLTSSNVQRGSLNCALYLHVVSPLHNCLLPPQHFDFATSSLSHRTAQNE